jgi:hypothetical protein
VKLLLSLFTPSFPISLSTLSLCAESLRGRSQDDQASLGCRRHSTPKGREAQVRVRRKEELVSELFVLVIRGCSARLRGALLRSLPCIFFSLTAAPSSDHSFTICCQAREQSSLAAGRHFLLESESFGDLRKTMRMLVIELI